MICSYSVLFFNRFSSSFCVSEVMSSSSDFFIWRSFFLSSRFFFDSSIYSIFSLAWAKNSLILFSLNSISRVWYSISFESESNSLLFLTLFCCSSYFLIRALEFTISFFLLAMAESKLLVSSCSFSMRVSRPAISSSRSCTSRGNSPLKVLILSISELIFWSLYIALSFSSTVSSATSAVCFLTSAIP